MNPVNIFALVPAVLGGILFTSIVMFRRERK